MKFKSIRLSPKQLKLLAGAFSNIAQAIILFSAAAFFVPETVNLSIKFSKILAISFFITGLLLLIAAVILSSKEKE